MRSTATLLLFATAEISGFAISRRRFVAAAIPLAAAAPALAAPAEADLVKDLVKAKASLEELPKMVGDRSWDTLPGAAPLLLLSILLRALHFVAGPSTERCGAAQHADLSPLASSWGCPASPCRITSSSRSRPSTWCCVCAAVTRLVSPIISDRRPRVVVACASVCRSRCIRLGVRQ